jgi:hypothetical protein
MSVVGIGGTVEIKEAKILDGLCWRDGRREDEERQFVRKP